MGAAIEIRGVSKQFRLYHEHYSSLKERVIHWGRIPFEPFMALDGIEHAKGPFGPDAFQTLEALDGMIGELTSAALANDPATTIATWLPPRATACTSASPAWIAATHTDENPVYGSLP